MHLCYSDQEMPGMDVDLRPETVDDDSYSSSFVDTDSDDDDKDEFGINKHYLANEIRSGFHRVHVEKVDPVAQKLQSFLNSDILPKQSMFYILLKNAVTYVDWLVKREKITVFNSSGTVKFFHFLKVSSIMAEERLLTY